MMKILIDCGAFKGKSLIKLKEMYSPDVSYGFEPVRKYFEIARENNPNDTIINKCVWISDVKKKIYIGDCEGSSLYGSKRSDNIRKDKYQIVECIDFVDWIKKNFSKEDFIILKMDIEGAEYPILNKMIKTEAIDYVNILHCEWHYKKIRKIKPEQHFKLLKKLKKSKIEIKDWRKWR